MLASVPEVKHCVTHSLFLMNNSPSIDFQKFSAMLKTKRGGRGLRVVADEISGVSASTLSRIEQGNIPDLETFMRICKWLGVSAEDFRPVESGAAGEAPA